MWQRAQSVLFDDEETSPSLHGLTYVSEAVTGKQEAALAASIALLDFQPFAFRGFTGRRRTVSFGWRYDFNGGGFQAAAPLPKVFQRARAVLAERLNEPAAAFEQCSVIEYAPGAGIGWHKDRSQFAKVAGLSLLAPCRFRFRRGGANGWERYGLTLQPRSAYLLDADARQLWQHSIPQVHALRYAITFRTLARPDADKIARGAKPAAAMAAKGAPPRASARRQSGREYDD